MSWIVSLAMIAAGIALIATFFIRPDSGNVATNSADPGGFNVPRLGAAHNVPEPAGPEDKTLKLTIPAMNRVDNATVPNVDSSHLDELDTHTAVHLAETGFPWQQEANVYIAGHRLGYPRTPSFLAFYDLDNLKDGDKIYVKDSTGKKYTYKVFRETVVSPTNLQITKPIDGENILTLQSCTLPDYTKRLIVQARLVKQA